MLHRAQPGHLSTDHLPRRPHVAVVGAGIAGLAAATGLAERGVRVTLLERESQVGGRLAGWDTTLRDGSTVSMNRGFHAFFRQYYTLRDLLRRGDPELAALTPLGDYPLQHRDGHRDTFAGLPRTPPWNAFAFAARSPTFGSGDIARLDHRAALPLAQVSVPEIYHRLDALDAREFLDGIRFPDAAKRLAFSVFSRSFFAAPQDLSAAELATMFHLYFVGSSEGLLFDVPRENFPTSLWQPLLDHLTNHDVELRTSSAVMAVQRHQRRFTVHCTDHRLDVDGVVLACEVDGLRQIVRHSPVLGDQRWRSRIDALPKAPEFVVARWWLDQPVRPDRAPFLATGGYPLLDNISVLDRFDDGAVRWSERTGGSVVEAHAYALDPSEDRDTLVTRLFRDVRSVYPEIAESSVVDERHVYAQDCPLFPPGGFADRPPVRTPVPGLALAGDHVRIDLPVALMERAAATGMHAATTVLRRWGIQGHDLWTVPVNGRFPILRSQRFRNAYRRSA